LLGLLKFPPLDVIEDVEGIEALLIGKGFILCYLLQEVSCSLELGMGHTIQEGVKPTQLSLLSEEFQLAWRFL
jgi:hypothetical protein